MLYESLFDIVTKMPMFDVFTIDTADEDLLKKTLYLLFSTSKIELKCVDCDANYPFVVKHKISKDGCAGIYKYGGGWEFNDIDSDVFFRNKVIYPKKDEGIIEYTFICTMKNTHYQKMYLLYSLRDGLFSFRKIGQKPLNTDLVNHLSNEYRNVLKKYDAFDDFRFFEQSQSRNLLAGSCTYLRRVFEKMVNKMIATSQISTEALEKAKRFEDKVALIKNQFDLDIQEVVTNSYSLLSKGIHELSNDEIESFYGLMLEVICVQLESEKEKQEKETKRKELVNNIHIVTEKVK